MIPKVSEVKAEIGVFGGTGFYQLDSSDGDSPVKFIEELEVETPYGAPSDKIVIAEVYGKRVAFLPRHGRDHRYPPHKVPYRANIWAFKSLGVRKILGPCASGSLQPFIAPGDIVILDQLVDFTKTRTYTFFDGPITTHISFADPYCPKLRELLIKKATDLNLSFHPKGTVVVIEGPRFSTRAESRFFTMAGFDVINMTQSPEAILAREMEMCYAGVTLITDWDVGMEGHPEVTPVTHEMAVKIFKENQEKLKKLIFETIRELDPKEDCSCNHALRDARLK